MTTSHSAPYRAATQAFLDIAEAVTAEQLDLHHPDGWSARQIIHHVADSEAQSYARLRRLLAEPQGSVIQGYDESAWAECEILGYKDLPVENSLAVFASVRAASADLLDRISDSDENRSGVHTESGHYTIKNWLENYTAHPLDHAVQLLRALQEKA